MKWDKDELPVQLQLFNGIFTEILIESKMLNRKIDGNRNVTSNRTIAQIIMRPKQNYKF